MIINMDSLYQHQNSQNYKEGALNGMFQNQEVALKENHTSSNYFHNLKKWENMFLTKNSQIQVESLDQIIFHQSNLMEKPTIK